MTPTTAIQRAEQWRKEGASGEAAKVAIALLNELERVRKELDEDQSQPFVASHTLFFGTNQEDK